MPYPYGMQSAPAVGNGLGGLPRRGTAGPPPKTIELIYEAFSEKTVVLPTGFRSFRVTLIGGGYTGSNGGGGACAQSAIYPATPGQEIKYTLAASSVTNDDTCSFKDVVMTCISANGTAGGTASGGAINNRGGDGTGSYAGGAASPSGAGQNATSSSNGNGGDGPGAPGLGNSRTPGAGGGGPSMIRIELF